MAIKGADALPKGCLGETEYTPEEMEAECAKYTKVYDGQVAAMWKAAFDNNIKAMKSLHYYDRKGVDGFDACSREDRSMPTHIAALRGHMQMGPTQNDLAHGHTQVLDWLAALHSFDGRFVVNFNLRDDGGHTPLWLAASWGHDGCVKLLLSLPHVHPCIPDANGVSPEQTARRVGFVQIADAIKARAVELGVALPAAAYWDEPDKRWYVKKADEIAVDDDGDDDHPME